MDLGIPVGINLLGNYKGRIVPANGFAREPDLFGPQRLPVRLGGVGAVWAAFADVRLAK